MVKRKNVRERGKLKLSNYFQKFVEGDKVAVIRERSLTKNFPDRIQGRTGKINGKKGRAYIVEIKDQNKKKGVSDWTNTLKKNKNFRKGS